MGSTVPHLGLLTIRDAGPGDIDAVIMLDRIDTGLAKPAYWGDIFARYVQTPRPERLFLIAEGRGEIIGFIVGEIRAWEFGSPPSGWVFAIHVAPGQRERGVGTRLLDDIRARFKEAGVNTVRTMVSRRDTLNLSFFRSQGLTAGPYIELEQHLE
jgi:ribosomal protein S18 acetylase RimI-like enzyme